MFTCSHYHFPPMKDSATNCKDFIDWCQERKNFHFAQQQSVPDSVLQRSLALWLEGGKTDSFYQGWSWWTESFCGLCVSLMMLLNMLLMCKTPILAQQGAQRKQPCGYFSTYSRRYPGISFVNRLFHCVLLFAGVNLILLAHMPQGQCQLLWWETLTACGASKLPFL